MDESARNPKAVHPDADRSVFVIHVRNLYDEDVEFAEGFGGNPIPLSGYTAADVEDRSREGCNDPDEETVSDVIEYVPKTRVERVILNDREALIDRIFGDAQATQIVGAGRALLANMIRTAPVNPDDIAGPTVDEWQAQIDSAADNATAVFVNAIAMHVKDPALSEALMLAVTQVRVTP